MPVTKYNVLKLLPHFAEIYRTQLRPCPAEYGISFLMSVSFISFFRQSQALKVPSNEGHFPPHHHQQSDKHPPATLLVHTRHPSFLPQAGKSSRNTTPPLTPPPHPCANFSYGIAACQTLHSLTLLHQSTYHLTPNPFHFTREKDFLTHVALTG